MCGDAREWSEAIGGPTGCQIFLGTIYQNGEIYTKLLENIPNVHKIYEMGRKIDQMSIKYIYMFHCKTLQNVPKLQFWSENKPSGNPELNLNEKEVGHFA
jgi:hypothetical protein